jgi:acetyl-CoA synthetase (ADP-forming)
MDDALRVLTAAIEYARGLRAPQNQPMCPFPREALEGKTFPARQLTESEAKDLLRRAGIATTNDRDARSVEQAVRAAREIGYPVALKLVSRELTHKSDLGGVKLGLSDDAAVRQAWSDIAAALALAAPQHDLECVVQGMAGAGVELIVGSRWDAQFGALVMVGAGGIWVEVLADTQLALAPISAERAHKLLEALRTWPLLAGGRGQPRADIDSVADVLVRVSWLAAHLGPRLIELDINPLLVKPAGFGTIALDARATLHPSAS